jgi:signal transduction histidine kinase
MAPSEATTRQAPVPDLPQQVYAEQLRSALELAGTAVAYFDPTGRLQVANAAFASLVNRPESQLPGTGLEQVTAWLVAQLRNPAVAADRLVLNRLVERPAGEAALINLLNGQTLRLAARRSPDGALVVHARDVTHEMEVDRMKSEFLSTAAHELRTPMASILGFSELLMARSLSSAQTQEIAAIIHRQSAWLVEMVNELLDLARIEARRGKDFRFQPIQAQQLLDDTVKGQGAAAARVRCTVQAAVPMLLADPAKARHALANVLSNALKYSPEGSPVELHCHALVHQLRPGVAIVVRDAGIGMDAPTLARVFDRFFRANPSGQIPGTGLGMSLVREIMDAHSGQVSVQSKPGLGTSVTLWFPQPAESTRESATAGSHAGPPGVRG